MRLFLDGAIIAQNSYNHLVQIFDVYMAYIMACDRELDLSFAEYAMDIALGMLNFYTEYFDDDDIRELEDIVMQNTPPLEYFELNLTRMCDKVANKIKRMADKDAGYELPFKNLDKAYELLEFIGNLRLDIETQSDILVKMELFDLGLDDELEDKITAVFNYVNDVYSIISNLRNDDWQEVCDKYFSSNVHYTAIRKARELLVECVRWDNDKATIDELRAAAEEAYASLPTSK